MKSFSTFVCCYSHRNQYAIYKCLIFAHVLIVKVISERDLLGTQLVRRNEALALLYEKIKIQESIMSKGEMQYSDRLEDIRLLKLEVKRQKREQNILTRTVSKVEDLRYNTGERFWVELLDNVFVMHFSAQGRISVAVEYLD